MPVVPRSPRRLFRGLPPEVAILSSVSFTVALGYGIVAPSIPAFARQFGVSAAAAASVISAFALMRVAGALPAGRLVDRFGERRTMAAGIAIVALSSLLAGLSGSFAQLIVLRGVGGLGSAMFGVSGQTLLLGTVRSDQRGRASGLYTGGFLLGSISGPAIGGLVAAWSLRAPFFIYGAMLAVPAGIAFLVLRDRPRAATTARNPARLMADADPTSSARTGRPVAGIVQVLRSRAYQAAASANLADGFAVIGVRSAIVPLFVKDVLHRSPTWTGIGFGVVAALNAATLLPAGRIADTIGRRPVIVTGCLGSAAGMAVLAFAPGLWGFLTAMATLGLASGLLDVAPAAMLGDLIGKHTESAHARQSAATAAADPAAGPADRAIPADASLPGNEGGRAEDWEPGTAGSGTEQAETRQPARAGNGGGTVVASYQMAGDIGAVTGPVAVGFLVDSVSYQAAFLVAAGVLAAAACAGLAAPETVTPAGPGAVATGPRLRRLRRRGGTTRPRRDHAVTQAPECDCG